MTYIDLTQTVTTGIPDWDGCCGFNLTEQVFEPDICVQSMSTPLGIGTHIDAPCHMIPKAQDIAALPITQLIAKAVVIDISSEVHPEYFLPTLTIKAFENKYGNIPYGSLVLLHTGWSQYWNDPIKYRNVDSNGKRKFPGFSYEAAEYLLTKGIVGIGIDTLSPDGSYDSFPVHKAILGQGKYILENLCHLEQLPAMGAEVIALPIKIKNASESPARVIAKLTAPLS